MAEVRIIPARDRSKDIIRTAAYVRVSSDSDDQLNSYNAQIKYYTEMLSGSLDAVFVDMYADEGITGTSSDKRDDFLRLMKDCRKGRIDRVLTKSVSRFARNTKECLEAVRELKSLGISVYFEKENIDTGELSSEMLLAIHSQFAQEESISISRNVRMGFRKRMNDGTYIPSATPYGYIKDGNSIKVDEEKAKLVRRIFRDYLKGDSESTIAKRYGINIGTVKYILGNEKYTGDSLFHKWYTTDTLPFKCVKNNGEREMYYVSGTHVPIISREEYELAQELKREKGRYHQGKKTVSCTLRKKIYCGECGTLFKRKERKNRVFWVCRNHDQSAENCPMRQIDEGLFYTAFISMFNKLASNCQSIITPAYRQLQKLFSIGELANAQAAEIRKEIAEQNAQCHLLSQLNAQGIIDPVYYTLHSNEIERNLEQLQKQLRSMLNNDDKEEGLGKLKRLISILEGSEQITEFDEEIFRQIVERIIVISEKEIRFELICGMSFNEPIQREGR